MESVFTSISMGVCLTLVVLTVLFISNVAGLEVLEFNVAEIEDILAFTVFKLRVKFRILY